MLLHAVALLGWDLDAEVVRALHVEDGSELGVDEGSSVPHGVLSVKEVDEDSADEHIEVDKYGTAVAGAMILKETYE